MKGTYVLIIENSRDKEIEIGKLGRIGFKRGFYAYVGSALSGLEQRIERHLRREKRLHWHIDYLLTDPDVKVTCTIYKESTKREECEIAARLQMQFEAISGFGCSDCKCESHLFFSDSYDRLFEVAYQCFRDNCFKDTGEGNQKTYCLNHPDLVPPREYEMARK